MKHNLYVTKNQRKKILFTTLVLASLFLTTGKCHAQTLEVGADNSPFIISESDNLSYQTVNCGPEQSSPGEIIHIGGSLSVSNALNTGFNEFGKYTLENGILTVGNSERVGGWSDGVFSQKGGEHIVNQYLAIGRLSGRYYLQGGTLSVGIDTYLGYYGYGSMVHTDGLFSTGNLYVARALDARGNYTLNGTNASLSVLGTVNLGENGNATFNHVNGLVNINGTLNIGVNVIGRGNYILHGGLLAVNTLVSGYGKSNLLVDGGNLEVNVMNIGSSGECNFHINSSKSSMSVEQEISFGNQAYFDVRDAATITLNSALFNIVSNHEDRLKGLNKLTLVVDGDSSLEAASNDRGNTDSGYNENFAIDTVFITQNSTSTLVGNHDNASGRDAVYVSHLILEGNALLNQNGIVIYYKTLEVIPPPATILKDFNDLAPDFYPVVGTDNTIFPDVNERWVVFGNGLQQVPHPAIIVDNKDEYQKSLRIYFSWDSNSSGWVPFGIKDRILFEHPEDISGKRISFDIRSNLFYHSDDAVGIQLISKTGEIIGKYFIKQSYRKSIPGFADGWQTMTFDVNSNAQFMLYDGSADSPLNINAVAGIEIICHKESLPANYVFPVGTWVEIDNFKIVEPQQ
ncbi:hypothetical protein KDK77_09590 [bacterium]|nr:hypothetical protein [bacterium]